MLFTVLRSTAQFLVDKWLVTKENSFSFCLVLSFSFGCTSYVYYFILLLYCYRIIELFINIFIY